MKNIFLRSTSGEPPGVAVNSQYDIAHSGKDPVAVLTSIARQESRYVCESCRL